MTSEEFFQFVSDVRWDVDYKPGYWVEVEKNDHGIFIEVRANRVDCVTGLPGVGKGGWRYIAPNSDEQQIVGQLFAALKAYEEHECREFFKYKGKRIYGPHISLDALLEVADRTTYC